MPKPFIKLATPEEMKKFDFAKIIVEEPQKNDVASKEDKNGKNKKGKKSASLSYMSLALAYEYPNGEKGPVRFEFPWMETSGINFNPEFDTEDGRHKYQINSPILTQDYMTFFDNFRSAILQRMTPYLTKGSSNYSKELASKIDLEDINPSNQKAFRPIYRNSKHKPNVYRIYFSVKEYTSFHLPQRDAKGRVTTTVIPHKKLKESEKCRLKLELHPIWQPSYIYVGSKNSIVHRLDEALVKRINILTVESAQQSELHDVMADDYDEEENRRVLAEMENVEENSSEEEEESEEEEARLPRKSTTTRKPNKFKSMMDDDEDEENEEVEEEKPKKTKSKSKKKSSEEENED